MFLTEEAVPKKYVKVLVSHLTTLSPFCVCMCVTRRRRKFMKFSGGASEGTLQFG